MDKRYLINYYKGEKIVKVEEKSLGQLFSLLEDWDNKRPKIVVYEIGNCVLDWS